MTFDQIRTFFWVARLGGFRRAADRLHLSQPAVSTRISNLEQELRVPLFERGPGGLVQTKQGTLLLSYAEQMLFVEEEINQRVSNPSEAEGLFRVGASETIAQAWLPDFLKAFSQQYPRVNVDLTVDISLNLRSELLERKLDLALLTVPSLVLVLVLATARVGGKFPHTCYLFHLVGGILSLQQSIWTSGIALTQILRL